ncbi:MAG: hypothetical protein IPG66_17745 [Hydrogenophilales bacterium]|jgi:hypothetical protein|nr:hypothetical protein [Hydrogenophilales bacterium]
MKEEKKSEAAKRLILSLADELKKLSYLGTAGMLLLFGNKASQVVDGPTMMVIAIAWYLLMQVIAHILLACADCFDGGEK